MNLVEMYKFHMIQYLDMSAVSNFGVFLVILSCFAENYIFLLQSTSQAVSLKEDQQCPF